MKKPVTLLTRNQFGYQTDYFNYAKYLCKSELVVRVSFVCIDAGLPKIESSNVDVNYVADTSSSKLIRFGKLIFAGYRSLKLGHTLVVKYFPGVSLLRLSSNRKNIVLDLRTMSVSPNSLRRFIQDLLCKVEISGFQRITVISKQVAQKLSLKDWHPLPLGANPPEIGSFSETMSQSRIPILVYAGTLDGRDLTTLIKGFEKACSQSEVRLRVIGSGKSLDSLVALVSELGITDRVEFLGHVPHGEEFSKLLLSSSIGIVHVPPTTYYSGQPSTKLYEYWAHGLPVLCSNYPAGADEVQIGTGLVYDFTENDLAANIVAALKQVDSFDYAKIRELAEARTWEKVVESYILPILDIERDI